MPLDYLLDRADDIAEVLIGAEQKAVEEQEHLAAESLGDRTGGGGIVDVARVVGTREGAAPWAEGLLQEDGIAVEGALVAGRAGDSFRAQGLHEALSIEAAELL